MRKLISYSLYGMESRYVLNMISNLRIARDIYPGWDLRIYITRDHYAIPEIRRDYPWVQIVEQDAEPGSAGMFWRLYAMHDMDYSHVIVRDADSRLDHREAALVEEWIMSGKPLHAIRDHPAHNNIPLLGGAFGCITNPKYEQLNATWSMRSSYGNDETYLKEWVYDKNATLAHSSQNFRYGDEVAIPPAPDGNHVCQWATPPFTLDKLYVINPAKYKDRYARFLEGIATSKILSALEVVRVEATPIEQEVLPSWADKNNPHYWAVSQDHQRLLKEIILRGEHLALILEDDAYPTPDFDEHFQNMWDASMAVRWTAFMLGGQHDDRREYVPGADALALTAGTLGQHAVLYNHQGMREFLDHARYWNHQSIDVAFSGYQQQSRKVYSAAKWVFSIEGTQHGKDT